MQAPTLEQLSSLEAAFGFVFPPSYRGLIENLPTPLRRSFARARFVTSADEIRRVHRKLMPSSLLPFLVEPQPHHDDYYCFDRSTTPPEYGIAVFAIHTTVAKWQSLADWLRWVEKHV